MDNNIKKKNKTFVERLYKRNILPDGNLVDVPSIDQVIKKIEDPPLDDEEKGSL